LKKWDGEAGTSFPLMIFAVPYTYNVEYFLTSCGPVNFSGRTLLHGVSELVGQLVG
jgi:hypothetical protein